MIELTENGMRNRNVRVPNGNEIGANKHWIAAGHTKGGYQLEAVIDPIPEAQKLRLFKTWLHPKPDEVDGIIMRVLKEWEGNINK